MKPSGQPYVVYATETGEIFEDKSLYAIGRTGWDFVTLGVEDFMELPEGSDLFVLPGRVPVGVDVKTGQLRRSTKGFAVSAQMSPAHTMTHIAAFEKLPEADTLPLYAYTAMGWRNGKFYVTALRVDKDIRQEPKSFNQRKVQKSVKDWYTRFPENRLLQHIGNNCALTYKCPAARNFFLNRFEAPIPTSPACNSNCIGCISFQPEDEIISSTQDRITFKPTADEIEQYATYHLEHAPYPIVSFGQGCEGEPLLMWHTIKDAIAKIRAKTDKGSININTNGSMPAAVEQLCRAGLDSIRVSMNSAREEIYNAYYLPNNYKFDALKKSLQTVRKHGGWASINYFVFPGVTDEPAEYEALRKFIRETDLTMIQWRNFNIDPDWYLNKIGKKSAEPGIGVKQLMDALKEEFPHLTYGYFNPPMEKIKKLMPQKTKGFAST